MSYFFLVFFLLTNLFADSHITAVTENDPSSFVDGVSAITGDFYSYDEDYLVEGAEPISLRRSYLSRGVGSDNYPHLYASFWCGVNTVCITEPNGTQFLYRADPKNGFVPEIGDSFFDGSKKRKALYYRVKAFTEESPGITNTSTGKISGQTNLQNQFVVFDPNDDEKGKSFTLFTADGTKRRYVNLQGQEKTKAPHRGDDFYLQYNYKLISEMLPNGHVIHYEWNSHNRVKRIRTSSKNHKKTFASIDLPIYDPKHPPLEVKSSGSDGRSLVYRRKEVKKREVPLLEQISAPDLPKQFFDWEIKQRPLLSHYSLPNKRTLQIAYEEGPLHRVKTLSSPIGKDEKPIVTQSFFYDVGTNQTDVRDAKGFKTSYFWNDKYRLTHIDRFGEADKFESSEAFVWNGTLLQSKWLVDQDRKPLFLRKYKYDLQGNVKEELFFGNLSGQGPTLEVDPNGDPVQNGVECFAKTSTYVDERKNLLQEESGAHGLSIRYHYWKETNLPEAKELLEHGEVKVRHTYTYDDDHILVRETIDDGQTIQIKKIHPFQEGPYLGLPEIIEDKYLDGGNEILLRKTVLKYKDGAKIGQKEIYDSDNKLQYILQFTYDRGQLATETNPIGQMAENKYDEVGNRFYSKDFSGRIETTFSYDHSNRLIRKEEKGFDGISRVFTYDYDTKHNLETERDFRGNETKHQYNAFNQKIQTELPPVIQENEQSVVPVLKYGYDSASNEILRIDAKGHETKTTYNAYGKPITLLHPDGAIEEYRYNLDGSLKTHTDPNGVITSYTYDYLGRTTSKKIGNVIVEIYTYKGLQLEKKIDAEKNETIYTYDKAGRKSSETFGGETVIYSYDSMGRVQKTQKGDLCLIYKYNLLDQIIEERNESDSRELLLKIAYSYDDAGNRKEILRSVNGLEAKETFVYDSQNRPTLKTDALGHQETVEYNDAFLNSLGQKVLQKTHTDPMGLQTIETYDALGRLVQIEKKKAQTLALSEKQYDLNGHLILQVDTVFSPDSAARKVETRWHYNSRGHLDTLTEAGIKTTSYTYYPRGELKTVTKPNGVILFYEYNDLGHLLSLTSSDGTVSHHMTYNWLGHLLTTDGIIRTVDPYGRLISESFPSGISISNHYDEQGRRDECRIPRFDCLIEYRYDAAHLKQVERKTLSGKVLYSHTCDAYDLSSNLLQSTLINGDIISYTPDLLSRHSKLQSPHFQQEITRSDPAGNIREMKIQNDLLSYTYDDLYQLTSETGPFAHAYIYDSLNNRLQKDSLAYQVNDLNQLSSHFQYDLNSNPISQGDTTYTYDALDRLIKIETPTQTQIFSYDSLHRCLAKTTLQNNTSSTQYFLYDGQNEIGSVRPDSTELRILGLAPHAEIGAAIAVEFDQVPYAPIHDLQGNVAVLVPLNNTIPTFYRYSAFGEERIQGSAPNPWRFCSKRCDKTTGLINFGRRYYLPELGRWLTPDPAGFTDGMNLYAYIHNDPLTHLDEYGLLDYGQWSQDKRESNIGNSMLSKIAHDCWKEASPVVLEFTRYARSLPVIPFSSKRPSFRDNPGLNGHVFIDKLFGTNLAGSYSTGGWFDTHCTICEVPTPGEMLSATKKILPLSRNFFGKMNNIAMAQRGQAITSSIFEFPEASTSKQLKKNITNPFSGRTFEKIDYMFKSKEFRSLGPDPLKGKGSYFHPRTGRRYYLDYAGKVYRGNIKEMPHVDVYYKNHVKGIEKKRLPLGDQLYEFE